VKLLLHRACETVEFPHHHCFARPGTGGCLEGDEAAAVEDHAGVDVLEPLDRIADIARPELITPEGVRGGQSLFEPRDVPHAAFTIHLGPPPSAPKCGVVTKIFLSRSRELYRDGGRVGKATHEGSRAGEEPSLPSLHAEATRAGCRWCGLPPVTCWVGRR
jgi:hypothetical protein